MSVPLLQCFKRFDVRDLIAQGDEPLPQILDRVHRLGRGQGLVIIAPFLPSPLVERL
jgi:uncharacterized protein (DUF2249 family)